MAASQGCQRQISCVHGAGDRGQPCYVACAAGQFRAELLPRGAIARRGDITNLRAHTFPGAHTRDPLNLSTYTASVAR